MQLYGSWREQQSSDGYARVSEGRAEHTRTVSLQPLRGCFCSQGKAVCEQLLAIKHAERKDLLLTIGLVGSLYQMHDKFQEVR